MLKRLVNSGVWLGAALILSLAVVQPVLADGCCSGSCNDGSACMLAQFQGTNDLPPFSVQLRVLRHG